MVLSSDSNNYHDTSVSPLSWSVYLTLLLVPILINSLRKAELQLKVMDGENVDIYKMKALLCLSLGEPGFVLLDPEACYCDSMVYFGKCMSVHVQ